MGTRSLVRLKAGVSRCGVLLAVVARSTAWAVHDQAEKTPNPRLRSPPNEYQDWFDERRRVQHVQTSVKVAKWS